MPSFRSACALAIAALLIGCGQDASEETSSTESALIVCAPEGGPPLAQGIDVSHYDGTIDWNAVQGGGIDFAIAKATEGTTFTDPQFAANWAGMQDAGVVRGAYHFFHPELDPDTQAAFVVSTVGPLAPEDLPLILDLETNGGESETVVVANALTFLTDVEAATGRTPIIYTSNRVIATVSGGSPKFAHYPLWDAQYGVGCPTIPAPWTTWNIWQTNDNGTIAGVSGTGNVDVDTFNGTIDDLHIFISGTPDAGPISDDSGTRADAGSISDPDSGATDDASTSSAAPDASGSGGCACSLTRESQSSPAWSWLCVAALALVLRRKR
ncbi:MAG: GH25 family lysozyme [Polyangiaceae bacterium]